MKNAILLVDDEPNILKSLERVLSEEGYCVFTAHSGANGLDILSKNTISVVISDQRMPLMKGSEFLKLVKDLYPDTIRMILSSYPDFDAVKAAINDGAIFKFISKPWQNTTLLQYVREAVELGDKKQSVSAVLPEQILRDRLTDLPNRFAFYDSLRQLILEAKKNHQNFAVLCFDVDRFSDINSALGEKKADAILKKLSTRLKKQIINENNVARLGNDEFVVLITDNDDLSNLVSRIKTIISIIKRPVLISEKKHYITASMGVCLFPGHGDSVELLMKNVRLALHQSKEMGGDNYQFFEFYNKMTDRFMFLEDELYEALEKKQFVIHYQPIYTMDKSKMVSVEALLRWQHPKHGLLFPGMFLNFCEKSNLIVTIGAWVLRVASQQMKVWHNMGFSELGLSVNFSVRQFNHPHLLELIMDVLESTELNPSCLEVEITETLLMQNPDKIGSLLSLLRGLGVQLALDDFGTGYSSLSYLKQFPFTHLKIDKSFITDMDLGGSGEAIVDAIISLGKILGIKIIAEGVETKEQLALLQTKRCDFVQGFLYAKPLPASELEQLLLNQLRNEKM